MSCVIILLGIPAVEALQKGLTDLQELFEHVLHTFKVSGKRSSEVCIKNHACYHEFCSYCFDKGCVHSETGFGILTCLFYLQGSVDNFRQHEQLLTSSQEE